LITLRFVSGKRRDRKVTTSMVLHEEQWMNVRRFRALQERGASISEIARETGHDWRTVKKYLDADAPGVPPVAPPRRGAQPRKTDTVAGVVSSWLLAEPRLKGTTIHERLVAGYGFDGSYQRVKMLLAELRPSLPGAGGDPLAGLHRRFEVTAGAQGQVDWGDEGDLLAHLGVAKVYSFHMVLSWSRDPFCCFTTRCDLGTFFDCHRRAFAHFGGIPGALVYDRTKTVVKRHVTPGAAVPLHPEAAAFAEHYGFTVDVLAAYRPTGKGRVERQVNIVREHVVAGRTFDSLADLDAAFAAWVPIRRAQVHRTHGQVIGDRAEVERSALRPLPAVPYLVSDAYLRRVGKDCLVSFEGSLYSVPATRVPACRRVVLRVTPATVTICAVVPSDDGTMLLAVHPRASARGTWQVDPRHWAGLPDGHTRRVTVEPAPERAVGARPAEADPLAGLLTRHPAAGTVVGHRGLDTYLQAAGLGAAS
jgi:transposase